MLPSRNSTIFFVFVVLSIALRFYSFFPSVINHDESTYLIMGRDILHNKALYVDVVDIKPVGIFVIYSFFHAVFGYSIFLTRLFVAVLVALSSFLIFRSGLKLFKDKKSAFAAGIIYIFYTSIWSHIGVAPNTEVFFNFTTILGFYLLLFRENKYFFLAGLVFGLGFMIKYLVLFDFVFLMLFFFVNEIKNNYWKLSRNLILKNILSGIGFILPFIVTHIYFYLNGNYEAFAYITYELPSRYGSDQNIWLYLVMILDYLARFLPISFLFFYTLFARKSILTGWQKQMFIVWIVGVLIAIYLPGKNFVHYTMQLMVPFSFVAGLFFHSKFNIDKVSALIFGRKWGSYLLILAIIGVQYSAISSKDFKEDMPRKVSSFLESKMKPDDTIYASNYKHIVYYLLKKECPTKYVHPTLMLFPEHIKAYGMDVREELNSILEKKPDFIVLQYKYELLEFLIKEDYTLIKEFSDKIKIYQLK